MLARTLFARVATNTKPLSGVVPVAIQNIVSGLNTRCMSSTAGERVAELNDLQLPAGSAQKSKRLGRGPGSGYGKMAAKGHKGAKARTGVAKGRMFEGGQTPLHRRVPKRGFNQHNPKVRDPLNLSKLMMWIETGRLDASKPIMLKDLYDSNIVGKFKLGIKLLGEGAHLVNKPIHIEVSSVTDVARKAIEDAGGSVTTVYYNKLALRAHLMPHKFDILPKAAGVPPKHAGKFDKIGSILPEKYNLESQ